MIVRVDLSEVPPQIVLEEPDDFTAFKVVLRAGDETHVSRTVLEHLAGDRARDPEWMRSFEAMLAYAQTKDWIREDGAVRGHVDRA